MHGMVLWDGVISGAWTVDTCHTSYLSDYRDCVGASFGNRPKPSVFREGFLNPSIFGHLEQIIGNAAPVHSTSMMFTYSYTGFLMTVKSHVQVT